MKQALLILSVIMAAFIAACSDSVTSIPAKTNGLQKTLEQKEQASTDVELKKLKAQLEKNKNVEIPDIIAAVKMKFGHTYSAQSHKTQSYKNQKEQPQFEPQDNKKKFEDTQKETEKDASQEKLTQAPSFEGVAMVDSASDPSVVFTSNAKNEESKHICIQTCEKQIIVLRKMNDAGKVISVSAFVAAEISSSKMEISTKTNKTIKSIAASFDVGADRVALKFNMTKDKEDMVLVTNDFSYYDEIKDLDFSDEAGNETGILDVIKVNENKSILMSFVSDKDVIKIKLKDDLGVFGKNKTSMTEDSLNNIQKLRNRGIEPSRF